MAHLMTRPHSRLRFAIIPLVLFASLNLPASLNMAAVTHASEPDTRGAFRIAGYLPEYRFAQLDAQLIEGVTDLILFSAEVAVDGSLDASRLKSCPWDRLTLLTSQSGTRLALTIGGWERSANFAAVAESDPKRNRFVTSTTRFAIEHQLGGIDLDWEHPKNAREEQLYSRLLQDLQRALKPHNIQLSVTIAAWQNLPSSAIEAVDFVQIMSYDHDGQHATLEQSRKDLRKVAAAGVPLGKLVLGLPFYGRDVNDRSAMTYGEVVQKHHPDPSVDQIGALYFNGPKTIREKTKMAVQANLGGVMIWELGQDGRGDTSLLEAIRQSR